MSQPSRLLSRLAFTGNRGARRKNRARAAQWRPIVDALEDRVVLSASPTSLGTAGQFGVLGLQKTQVTELLAQINGNEGVSKGGAVLNLLSKVTGNVSESANGQYLGLGAVDGSVAANSSLLAQVDADASSTAAAAAALTPTQTFGTIAHSTTVTGNGGLNVIAINGNIHNSLILSGTSSDIFIVNVTGNVNLTGGATLGLAGGVTAAHVLYNFTGGHGSINIAVSGSINRTLLAPNYDVTAVGTFNGEIIAGGASISILASQINAIPFSAPAPATGASLSGIVASEGVGLSGVTVTLTGTDSQGNTVTLTTTTASDGSYSFTGLQPGTYTIEQPQIPGYNGFSFGGSVSGNYNDDTVLANGDIADIVLAAGDLGANFIFSEVVAGS